MHLFPATVSSLFLSALSATELRRMIGTKEISPVELLESCIARIEALDPAVNAIAATAYGRARTEARAADAYDTASGAEVDRDCGAGGTRNSIEFEHYPVSGAVNNSRLQNSLQIEPQRNS